MSKTTHVYLDSNGDRLVVEAGGTLLLTGATVTGTIGCSAPATLAVAGAATVGTTLDVTGQLTVDGGATNPGISLSGAGNLATEGRTVSGTHVADGGTFAFAADQKSMRIKIGATVYQIPLWADA